MTLYPLPVAPGNRAIAVFVGGDSVPTEAQCYQAIESDPHIKRPILVLAFGGLPDQPRGNEDQIAQALIEQFTPGFADLGLAYAFAWVKELLLVKVMMPRSGVGLQGSMSFAGSMSVPCSN
jgi:hypothetical protein